MAKKAKRPHQPTRAAMYGTHAASESATKRGPGRYHSAGKPGNRLTKERPTRAYVALCAAWAQKRITKAALRDEHGAYTLVGSEYIGVDGGDTYRPRRKWLAGISAQRGY